MFDSDYKAGDSLACCCLIVHYVHIDIKQFTQNYAKHYLFILSRANNSLKVLKYIILKLFFK